MFSSKIRRPAAHLLLAASMAAVTGPLQAVPKEKIPVDLYVMTLCPFGVQAENALFPAVKSLEKYVDLRLHFIANEAPPAAGETKPSFSALHGQPEVDESLRQLCVQARFPRKALDYILERNKDYRSADWRPAAKAVGVDPDAVGRCAQSEEGARLLSENLKAHRARKAFASPTIDVAGEPYTGGRGPKSMAMALCGALEAAGVAPPDACGKAREMPDDPAPAGGNCAPGAPAPEPVAFDIRAVTVTDGACKTCEPTLLDALKKQHPGARIKVVDSSSSEGKELVERFRIQVFPFYILDKAVEGDPNFKALVASFYSKSSDAYVIQPGAATYAPGLRLDRPREPRHLDLFVEPLSQASAQAEAEVIRFLLGSKIKDLTFSVHFFVQEGVRAGKSPSPTPAGDKVRAASLGEASSVESGALTSERGAAEVKESLRQVCLFQKAPLGTFFAYLKCRNQNLQDLSRGEACLQADEALRQCIQGPEGEGLLRQDARLARELDISQGPVLMWENRQGPLRLHEADWRGLLSTEN